MSSLQRAATLVVARHADAEYVETWFSDEGGSLTPIGGCATADTADGGVVDHAGRVFHPEGGLQVGLYLADGSVLPRAIGVNPFLTISVFSERMVSCCARSSASPSYDTKVGGDDRA